MSLWKWMRNYSCHYVWQKLLPYIWKNAKEKCIIAIVEDLFGVSLASFLKIISKVLKWQYSEICTKLFLWLPCQCSQHKALKGGWYWTVARQANNELEDLKVKYFRILENHYFCYLSRSKFKMLTLLLMTVHVERILPSCWLLLGNNWKLERCQFFF